TARVGDEAGGHAMGRFAYRAGGVVCPGRRGVSVSTALAHPAPRGEGAGLGLDALGKVPGSPPLVATGRGSVEASRCVSKRGCRSRCRPRRRHDRGSGGYFGKATDRAALQFEAIISLKIRHLIIPEGMKAIMLLKTSEMQDLKPLGYRQRRR